MKKKMAPGTKGTYRGFACIVDSFTSDSFPGMQLLRFPNVSEDNPIGWVPDSSDIDAGIAKIDKSTYLWVFPSDEEFIQEINYNGYNCVVCNDYNKWAAANLTDDRHICYSCKASYHWKFEGEFLE